MAIIQIHKCPSFHSKSEIVIDVVAAKQIQSFNSSFTIWTSDSA